VTDAAEKRRVMGRIGPNLATLDHLLEQNGHDFRIAISRKYAMDERRDAWRRLVRRRYKAIRLVEELNLRTQRLQPLADRLVEISRRMDVLMEQLDSPEKVAASGMRIDEIRGE